jgi:ketosteroid isomerase-like protein
VSRCASDLALERYLLGELDAQVERAHIDGCARCHAVVAAKHTAGNAYMMSPEARAVARMIASHDRAAAVPVSRRRSRMTIAIGIAAVVGLALWLWPRGETDRRDEVLAVEREWMDAYVHNDVDALDRILADDYKLTDSFGRTRTKADDLANAREGGTKYDAYDTSDVRVRVWGDTAVVTGRSVIRGASDGQPFAYDITFTDTLAHIGGRWRAVSAHLSRTRPR